MTEFLLQSVQKLGHFTSDDLKLVTNAFEPRTLEKGKVLLHEGDICRSIFLVVKGAIYHYTVDSGTETEIIDLAIDGDWILNYASFTAQRPSEGFIKVHEESQLYEITIETLHRLIALSQSFLQLGRVLEGSTRRMDLFGKFKTPDERYLYILHEKPGLLQKFPQKLIASYLGMTPETLSRVRKRI